MSTYEKKNDKDIIKGKNKYGYYTNFIKYFIFFLIQLTSLKVWIKYDLSLLVWNFVNNN